MKQVVLINESIALPRGKLAAQVAHASVACLLSTDIDVQEKWLECGMPKIVLSAANEAELLEYYQKALDANLPAQLIRDAGRTVVESGTLTCIGIGPAKIKEIDKITNSLKLVV